MTIKNNPILSCSLVATPDSDGKVTRSFTLTILFIQLFLSLTW